MTQRSVILYIGILDEKKGFLRSGWSSHDDISSTLGFLQYVFLPTALHTWIDRNSDGFYIPLSPFDILKEEVLKKTYKDENFDANSDAVKMERAYDYLSSIWKCDDDLKMSKLRKFCLDFNRAYDQEPEKKLFVRIFEKCGEIPGFILENMENEFEEVIEEEIQMPINELKHMCENAYDEPLINRNFVKILNDRIPIWF